MTHPALNPDSVAVITGGASGIGLASAMKFAAMGMRLAIADRAEDKLAATASALRAAGAADVMTAAVDVSERAQVEALEAEVTERFGGASEIRRASGRQKSADRIEFAVLKSDAEIDPVARQHIKLRALVTGIVRRLDKAFRDKPVENGLRRLPRHGFHAGEVRRGPFAVDEESAHHPAFGRADAKIGEDRFGDRREPEERLRHLVDHGEHVALGRFL